MMDGPGGRALTKSIQEAVAFGQTMGRVHRQFVQRGEWFFDTWNPNTVKETRRGRKIRFEDASADRRPSEV